MVNDNTPAAIFGVFVGIVATLAIVRPLLLRLVSERDAARNALAIVRRCNARQAQTIASLQDANSVQGANVMALAHQLQQRSAHDVLTSVSRN